MRDKTAIVRVGTTAYSAFYRNLDLERSSDELAAAACRAAVVDTGLTTAEVDGIRIGPQRKRSTRRHSSKGERGG